MAAEEPSTSGRPAKLDQTSATGDGCIFYPSGNIAVVVCKQEAGHIITFFTDSQSSQVLGSFDNLGQGGVNYSNGKPWLVVTSDGYIVSNRRGDVLERGKWPRKSEEPIICAVSECIVITFQNKQKIMATFNCEDVVRTWPCGEQLKRTEPLASLGKGRGGKLILDLPKIRARQAAVGSVYVPPGPHQQESERPGLGALRAALRKLDEDSLLSSTVRDLQSLDKRMSMVTTLPKMMTGTMRSVNSGSAGLGASGLLGSSGSIPFEDYGSPALSETQKRFSSTMRSVKTVKPCYKSRRVKLPLLRQADLLAKVMGTAAPSDTLIWVSVLADWNPVCFRIESVLETLHSGFCQDAAANRSSEGAHVKMYKYDASQSSFLQDKYHFRSVPMYLGYYQGKLVYASNALCTAEEMRSAALGALTAGRKGEVLREGFSFNGRDNALLDGIHENMSLLRGAA